MFFSRFWSDCPEVTSKGRKSEYALHFFTLFHAFLIPVRQEDEPPQKIQKQSSSLTLETTAALVQQ